MKMRKYMVFALGAVLLVGCSSDKKAQLQELIKQRTQLDKQITALQNELEAENGKPKEKITTVAVKSINPALFKHFVEAQGMVESDNNVFIPAQAQGIVKRILVDEGDFVKKDQLLAQLDDEILVRNRAELVTGLELATTVYERQKRLWEKKIGSEIQYLQAKNQKESLEKKLAALDEQIALYKITSPINGVVDKVTLKEGEAAAAGYGAVRVVQPGKLKITASLSERYVGNVKVKDVVDVKFPSSNTVFSHRITAISQVIDPNNRTFDLEIRLPKALNEVKPNMMAVLTINDYTNEEALTVPLNVVQKDADGKFLFVVEQKGNNWVAQRRAITTGLYYKNRVEILQGLKDGDKVIVSGFSDLGSGQTVSIEG